MVVTCEQCLYRYDDEFQWTICPHNPLECGPEAGAYCKRHDFFAPCRICAIEKIPPPLVPVAAETTPENEWPDDPTQNLTVTTDEIREATLCKLTLETEPPNAAS